MNDIESNIPELLPPLSDVVFSKIFESVDVSGVALKGIINAVLKDSNLPLIDEIVSIRSQSTQLGEVSARGCRIDVLAKDAEGQIFSIEVQLERVITINDRVLFNFGHIIQNEVPKGARYEAFPKITMINILGKDVRPEHPHFHHQAAVLYTDAPYEPATDNLAIHDIELPKFRAQLEREGKKLLDENPLALWLYVLDEGYKNPKFMEGVAQMDEGIRDFASRYNIVASDKELRHTYHNWLVGQMDRASELFQAEKKGRQEGEAKGKAEGKAEGATHRSLEIARALLSDGMSVEKVAALTKLSVAEISRL
ncbi:transposase [Clostridia bacterium]|nr:transposase [Clostridia bacterium]